MNTGAIVAAVLDRHGRTFASEAGIDLTDTPQPLFRLLCMSLLLATERNSEYGIQATRALHDAGLRSADDLAGADPETVIDAVGRAKYARRDEQHTDRLQTTAQQVLRDHGGDLRALAEEVEGDVDALTDALTGFKGMGAVGAAIFCREVQQVWPWVRPYADDRALAGADALGLGTTPAKLAALVDGDDLTRFVCALVRVDMTGDAHELRAEHA